MDTMQQVNRFKKTASGEQTLLMQIADERVRLAQLQTEHDRQGRTLISHVGGNSVAEVYELRNLYDQDWFARCLYSSGVKILLAQRLLDATRPFHSMIDTTVWTKIAEGQG